MSSTLLSKHTGTHEGRRSPELRAHAAAAQAEREPRSTRRSSRPPADSDCYRKAGGFGGSQLTEPELPDLLDSRCSYSCPPSWPNFGRLVVGSAASHAYDTACHCLTLAEGRLRNLVLKSLNCGLPSASSSPALLQPQHAQPSAST